MGKFPHVVLIITLFSFSVIEAENEIKIGTNAIIQTEFDLLVNKNCSGIRRIPKIRKSASNILEENSFANLFLDAPKRAVFDVNINENKQVIEYAIDRANRIVLNGEEFQLASETVEVAYGNEYATSRAICELLEKGVSAIFGPDERASSMHAADICDTKEIPYLDTRWDSEAKMPIINLYPNPPAIAEMLVDLVRASDWTSFTILYESAEWLPRMSQLLKMYDSTGSPITVRRLDLKLSVPNYRSILRRVKLSSDKCILVECSIDILGEVLKQAQQVGLMTDQHQFILTNFDSHTIDLEAYQYSGTSITTLRLIDPEQQILKEMAAYLEEAGTGEANKDEEKAEAAEEKAEGEQEGDVEHEGDAEENDAAENESENEEQKEPEESGREPEERDPEPEESGPEPAEEENAADDDEANVNPETETAEPEVEIEKFDPAVIRLQSGLLHDGVILLAETFKQLGLDQIQPIEIGCENGTMWENGLSISNFMRNTIVDGVTGPVKFDTNGRRTEFQVQIQTLTSHGSMPIGSWSPMDGIAMTKLLHPTLAGVDSESFFNRTFIVLTNINPPYGMLKDSSLELTGNSRFEGFGIDIIHELSLMLGFNYEFRLQADGKYGSMNNVTKEWDGMIRELQDGRADLAITDLTITAERESGADFTMPFMNLGISILFQKPSKQPPSTFSFMSPFSTDVWMSLGGAYFTVSICLFVLGRISPAEWDNPYPCIEEPTQLENQFSFANAMWFCIGALLQQGSEIAPKAPATRIVASIWWFFTLIMVSSYTANLAAFLTVETLTSPIKSVEDLKECGLPDSVCPVKFGAKKGGSTLNFFKEAEHPTYRNMYAYMMEHQDELTNDNTQGLEWAKTDNYAFLMESSSIEYIIERHCDVTQIGSPLDEKGYGIAMRKNSKYRNALSEGVLRLQESGKLATLKIKWWNEKKGGGACQDPPEEGALALEMANVEGVFYVLIAGIMISVVFAFIDVLLETRKRCKISKEKNNANEAQALGMENVKGVYIVLYGGCLIASVLGGIESCFYCCKRSRKSKVPFKKEFFDEMQFILKCESDVKVIREPKSQSRESQHSVASFHSNKSETEPGAGDRSNVVPRYNE